MSQSKWDDEFKHNLSPRETMNLNTCVSYLDSRRFKSIICHSNLKMRTLCATCAKNWTYIMCKEITDNQLLSRNHQMNLIFLAVTVLCSVLVLILLVRWFNFDDFNSSPSFVINLKFLRNIPLLWRLIISRHWMVWYFFYLKLKWSNQMTPIYHLFHLVHLFGNIND